MREREPREDSGGGRWMEVDDMLKTTLVWVDETTTGTTPRETTHHHHPPRQSMVMMKSTTPTTPSLSSSSSSTTTTGVVPVKKVVLSGNEIKNKTLSEIHSLTYEDVLPLQHLWQEYIRDVLPERPAAPPAVGPTTTTTTTTTTLSWKVAVCRQLATSVELVGSHVCVVRSASPCCVGHEGIVVMETEQTLRIVTPSDKRRRRPRQTRSYRNESSSCPCPFTSIKTLIKKQVVIEIRLEHLYPPHHRFLIYGRYIACKGGSPGRSKQKLKQKVTLQVN